VPDASRLDFENPGAEVIGKDNGNRNRDSQYEHAPDIYLHSRHSPYKNSKASNTLCQSTYGKVIRK